MSRFTFREGKFLFIRQNLIDKRFCPSWTWGIDSSYFLTKTDEFYSEAELRAAGCGQPLHNLQIGASELHAGWWRRGLIGLAWCRARCLYCLSGFFIIHLTIIKMITSSLAYVASLIRGLMKPSAKISGTQFTIYENNIKTPTVLKSGQKLELGNSNVLWVALDRRDVLSALLWKLLVIRHKAAPDKNKSFVQQQPGVKLSLSFDHFTGN